MPADYDEAVRTAARYAADTGGILVQDTAWHGYEEVPGWIVDGYSTLFRELDDQLADLGIDQPDLVLVPTGVGSLLQAALTHYRADSTGADTAVVSVEPVEAACVQASIAAGHPVSVATGHTIMAGLNCGTVSSLAWPSIHRGLDAAATVTDDQVTSAARDLADNGVPVGPCGAAPLAAARTLAATGGLIRDDSRPDRHRGRSRQPRRVAVGRRAFDLTCVSGRPRGRTAGSGARHRRAGSGPGERPARARRSPGPRPPRRASRYRKVRSTGRPHHSATCCWLPVGWSGSLVWKAISARPPSCSTRANSW